MLAKREHIKNLPILLEKTLVESGIKNHESNEIDYIAVTAGPGLEPALWTGITFAEELGRKFSKPVLPINHMEGHLMSFLFNATKSLMLPAIALLVSGGHTELVLMESFDNYKIIGKTRDDAVGEAFDKTARLLGFPYPGGPKISGLAARDRSKNQESRFKFPRPMLKTDDFDFSYSGLKTAVLYAMRKLEKVDEEIKENLARAFEDAAIEPLIEKTRKATEKYSARSIIIGGGVSANTYLRSELKKLCEENGLEFQMPERAITTDNAIMIGIVAYVRSLTNRLPEKTTIAAKGNLSL